MALKDDVNSLKSSVQSLITAFQTAQGNVQAAIDKAVADDEAGTDVDIKALNDQITSALQPVQPATEKAQAAVDAGPSS